MPKLADATFHGKSGTAYTFEAYALGTGFNAVGAVYVITKRTINNEGKGHHAFIYIGHTGDLSERFDNHHKAACFSKNGANCICVLRESNEDSRLLIESDLIDGNNTPCNG